MQRKAAPPVEYRFGPFCLGSRGRVLYRGDERIALTGKGVETLLVLLESAGRLVEKDTFMDSVWPDTAVEENNLSQSIAAIRKALSDDPASPRYIETVARRGYRFLAPLTTREEAVGPADEARAQGAPSRPGQPAAVSVAVLPFRVLSSQTDDPDLGIGLADTLIALLAKAPGLRVRPLRAVLALPKGLTDHEEVGRRLGVDFILDGTVRRRDAGVRVTVQLVRAADGTALFSERFEETALDPLALEDEIAKRLGAALSLKLASPAAPSARPRPTPDADTLRLYAKGRFFANRLTYESLEKAIAAFSSAIARDPSFALAYEGLAYAYGQALDIFLPPSHAMPLARNAAERAKELDPDLPHAYVALGNVEFWYERNAGAAEGLYRHAIALGPNLGYPHRLYGWCLLFLGRSDEALRELALAAEIDGHSMEDELYFVPGLYFARRYEEAIEKSRQTVEMYPGLWIPDVTVGRCHEALGDFETAGKFLSKAHESDPTVNEVIGDLGRVAARAGDRETAHRLLRELDDRSKTGWVSSYHKATIHIGLGDFRRALDELEVACDRERSWYATWLRIAPIFDALRQEERFQRLVERVGL